MPLKPIIEVAGVTNVGVVRKNNEDSFKYLAEGDDFWAAVADGCGGEAAGEVASHLAIDTFADAMTRHRGSKRDLSFILRDAVCDANKRIVMEQSDDAKKGMGTTFTGLFLRGKDAVVAHAGDSRLYGISNGVFRMITEDHTWVAEQVKLGKLKPEEAETHPRSSWLLKALGMKDFKSPAIDFFAISEGDTYMLCSDGLMRCVKDREIEEILGESPAVAAEKLVNLAVERGAPDNVTVIVLHVKGFTEAAAA